MSMSWLAVKQAFFTVSDGQSLNKRTVHTVFQRLRAAAGITPRGSYPYVRIHDLRHNSGKQIHLPTAGALADRCVIDNAIAALSTYVGHAKVSDTYWYMTGIPNLMATAGSRFEGFVLGENGHV